MPFGSSQWMYATGAAVEGQSLRFNDNDSAYLSWTPTTAGDRQKFTWSGWIKRGNLSSSTSDIKAIIGSYNSSSNRDVFRITDDNGKDILSFQVVNGGVSKTLYTSAVFRDVSAWYHIVLSVDTTQATAADRVNIYVNGEAQTLSGSYPTQNTNTHIANVVTQYLGARSTSGSVRDYFDGYMSEVNFVDGTQLDPTSFGGTDANGQWVPITSPSVTYGTNGYYLTFENGIGDDESGNSNDFTASNLATTDIVLDSPTNNFSTFNPTDPHGGNAATHSEGNLKASSEGSNSWSRSTYWIESGAYYIEILSQASGGQHSVQGNYDSYFSWTNSGAISFNGASVGTYSTHTSGDIIGLAIDRDANTVKFYKNNTLVYTGTSMSGGAIKVGSFLATSAGSAIANFGQDSSFAGNKVAQGNTDENGYGDFYYEPPAGYLALCTQNLPDPAIADGSDYFNTVLYTGDGTSSRSITGVGFQPDFVWLKTRSAADNHILQDAVRGNDRQLFSNTTEAELNNSTTQLLSFDSDGFTIGSDSGVNGSGRTFASWNWKANGSGSSNTDGSITSTVSANTTAGFSIVGYTGNLTAGATIGHGLSSAPDMIIVKNRDGATNWRVYHSALGATQYASLNATDAFASATSVWNDTEPTSSVFTVGASTTTNPSGSNLIAYCFHSVEGYSKFGSYTGNGSTDGPFVYTGFRPAFVIVKKTSSSGEWVMWDNKRSGYNVDNDFLYPNGNNSEFNGASYPRLDLVSNGFKMRDNSADTNGSGATYLYMAFAKNPFKYSNAR